ncbi:hypothetical protein BU23DRAFT_121777 [Bimuria novae-zelandiae CBS 107.79]|uniref:Uncharacterized protein n=1 Tax=Bimuria novae-zelandiae CBS 107.79 TaxID=1447943 RepID=A0A6A5VG47_9PLEO|nr:hypothetical protein BU23DRAFT_121777 [Bimuria novae-zelandiae CBS 107.79]
MLTWSGIWGWRRARLVGSNSRHLGRAHWWIAGPRARGWGRARGGSAQVVAVFFATPLLQKLVHQSSESGRFPRIIPCGCCWVDVRPMTEDAQGGARTASRVVGVVG